MGSRNAATSPLKVNLQLSHNYRSSARQGKRAFQIAFPSEMWNGYLSAGNTRRMKGNSAISSEAEYQSCWNGLTNFKGKWVKFCVTLLTRFCKDYPFMLLLLLLKIQREMKRIKNENKWKNMRKTVINKWLTQTHAIFNGIKRPMNDQKNAFLSVVLFDSLILFSLWIFVSCFVDSFIWKKIWGKKEKQWKKSSYQFELESETFANDSETCI